MGQADDDVRALLGRVGLHGERDALDALADPAATDVLAARLADRLRPFEPDVVVVWEGLQGVVLGYAVGLRLDVPVVMLSDDEGLVSSSKQVIADTRVAFVAATPPPAATTRMAISYLESWGAELVVTATLLGRTAGAVSTVTLVELPQDEPASRVLSRPGADLAPGQASGQDRR